MQYIYEEEYSPDSVRLIGSEEDKILTFFSDMVSIDYPQKTCPKRSILARFKIQIYFRKTSCECSTLNY